MRPYLSRIKPSMPRGSESVFIIKLLCAALAVYFAGAHADAARLSSKALTGLGHSSSPKRDLSFGDRVTYQRAIEEVYWRHRIWPAENPKSKPTLDDIIQP